jgi:hypothetical protein
MAAIWLVDCRIQYSLGFGSFCDRVDDLGDFDSEDVRTPRLYCILRTVIQPWLTQPLFNEVPMIVAGNQLSRPRARNCCARRCAVGGSL